MFLDLPLPDLDEPPPAVRPAASDSVARRDETVPATPDAPAASLSQRGLASAIDVLLLLGVDLVVVYLTMKISGFAATDLHRLAWPPLLAYLTLQDATYFVALTAGGQTLGKMAVGIRVVASGTTTAPDLSRAALRTLIWLAMAAPAGLGFLSVLFGADHRGLHDRLSGTRVVRAGL